MLLLHYMSAVVCSLQCSIIIIFILVLSSCVAQIGIFSGSVITFLMCMLTWRLLKKAGSLSVGREKGQSPVWVWRSMWIKRSAPPWRETHKDTCNHASFLIWACTHMRLSVYVHASAELIVCSCYSGLHSVNSSRHQRSCNGSAVLVKL